MKGKDFRQTWRSFESNKSSTRIIILNINLTQSNLNEDLFSLNTNKVLDLIMLEIGCTERDNNVFELVLEPNKPGITSSVNRPFASVTTWTSLVLLLGIFPNSHNDESMFLATYKHVLLYNKRSRIWKEMYSLKNNSTLSLWFSAHMYYFEAQFSLVTS